MTVYQDRPEKFICFKCVSSPAFQFLYLYPSTDLFQLRRGVTFRYYYAGQVNKPFNLFIYLDYVPNGNASSAKAMSENHDLAE
jgi:hypothetical protein